MTTPKEDTPSSKGGARRSRRTRTWIVLAGILIVVLTSVRVTLTDPRVHARWRENISSADREILERRYKLQNGSPVDETANTWRYELGTTSTEHIGALVQDPAVEDTGYIDRRTLTSEGRQLRVTRFPLSDLIDGPSQLRHLHPSLWLLLAGSGLLWAASALDERGRRNATTATLLFVGAMALMFPFEPSFVAMGEAGRAASRDNFETAFAGRVRYEKHLTSAILLEVYGRLERDETAPERALIIVSRGATVFFVLSAFTIGVLEQWSVVVLRYLGLVLLAPSALLFFGWRELGYLSLTAAAFPLFSHGLKHGGLRLEAGSGVAGLGAALHGSGLVSLAGLWMAALGAPGRLRDRVCRMLRVTAWATAGYLGWVAVYVLVLRLPIVPDPGPTRVSAWRSVFVSEVRDAQLSPAILSAIGARDVLTTLFVVGAPLLVVAACLRRRYPAEVRAALWYAPPSILFIVFRWPWDGVGKGMDLVVGGFPALFALAWVCAHDSKSTRVAGWLLASAHYVFWRVVLDERFDNVSIE